MKTKDFAQLRFGFICACVFGVIYIFILRPWIEPICVAKSVPVLSSMIEGARPLAFYLGKADCLAGVFFLFLTVVFTLIDPLKRLLWAFFLEKDSAYNLALFRIVLFLYVLWRFDKEKILWFSQLPKELLFPPAGTEAVLSIIPINAQIAGPIYDLFAVSCVCALIGFLPSISCWIAAVSGIYVLGIPQFFGKTDHYHHLIWFMMILGTSPCADVLSVSSVIRSVREPHTERPERSLNYGIPLRLVWILIGIIYFFPGFWKFVKSQWHWFLSNNLQYQMYSKWFELNGWTPFFRIDHYPWLCQLVGAATILFELSFIFVILFPSLRWMAIVSGLLFHNMTNAFMRISFYPLQVCYVSFINWEWVFQKMGTMLFRREMVVVYNASSRLACTMIAIFQKFDLFQGISYVSNANAADLAQKGLDRFKDQWAQSDFYLVTGERHWKDFEAFRRVLSRIPMFWIVYAPISIWPFAPLASNIYHRVKNQSQRWKPGSVLETRLSRPLENQWIKIVGAGLIGINLFFGFTQQVKAWPFACYPTFAGSLERAEIKAITFVGVRNGQEEPIDVQTVKVWMAPQKYGGLIECILADKNEERRLQRLQKLWASMKALGVNVSSYQYVRFYSCVRSTLPEKFKEKDISKKLMCEVKF